MKLKTCFATLVLAVVAIIFISGCIKEQSTELPSEKQPTAVATSTPAPTGTKALDAANKTPETTVATSTPAPTATPGGEEKTPEGPVFELKKLRTGVTRSDNTPGKLFYLTYFTNLDAIKVKIIAPDGSMSGPLSWRRPHELGEQERGILIPPRDGNFILPDKPQYAYPIHIGDAYVALPGTYRFVVYDESEETKIWEKNFTFQGAKLVIENASVLKWEWHYTWPFTIFIPEKIAITVSNKGDLPSGASVLLRFDDLNDPKDDQEAWLTLGFVAPGETKTFIVKEGVVFHATVYKKDDRIPSATQALSVRLVSDLPTPSRTKGFPKESLQYYGSPQNPYPIVIYKYGINKGLEANLLLLDDYSTNVETPSLRIGQ